VAVKNAEKEEGKTENKAGVGSKVHEQNGIGRQRCMLPWSVQEVPAAFFGIGQVQPETVSLSASPRNCSCPFSREANQRQQKVWKRCKADERGKRSLVRLEAT